ncbi:MAG: hypothetical protein C5B59_01870 [Bacteroidetes bacterium]|nr:MAG: hypothetical protein C5B59_01870 [Bacteroidota bacterium]
MLTDKPSQTILQGIFIDMMKLTANVLFAMVAIALVPKCAQAQKNKGKRKHEIYFSWGYNTEWYTHSNVYVDQPVLGNNYSFRDIKGHDHKGWDDGLMTKAFTIPQYNYRLGFIFNKEKGLGFEINFDHTKFIFADQNARIKGTFVNKPVDSTVAFNAQNGFFYYLNNGANFLLFNIVKRWHVYESKNENLKINFLGKAGIGPVIPHVENSFFGQKNDPHFQLGGWNVGVEGALRATFFKYVYIEYANKLDYARYSGLRIYKGTARQAFGTYEMILSFGLTFPVGKRVS